MNFRHVMIVLKKKIKDMIRDKKTIISSFVVPIVLIPVLMLLMGGGAEKFTKDITGNISIALAQNSNTDDIRKLVQDRIIGSNKNIKLVDSNNDIESVRQEKVRVLLEFDKDYAAKLKENKPFIIKILYDNSKTKSQGAVSVVKDAIDKFNQSIIGDRITALGLSKDILQPSIVGEQDVADKNKSNDSMLVMILPMLLGILIAVGGIAAATDLVAGEKERNTFEPLLTTRPSRLSILMGKYLTVTMFSTMTIISTGLAFVLSYFINPNSLSMGQGGSTGLYLPPLATVLVVVIAILMGTTFSGIQIGLSTFAKSFKEAQTYLSFLMIIAMVPAYATMYMQPNEIQTYMFGVPILNTICSFKMVLGGNIDYLKLVIAIVSSIVYVLISLALAVSMFKKEKYLFRS
jgi:sodium transport system permease protein